MVVLLKIIQIRPRLFDYSIYGSADRFFFNFGEKKSEISFFLFPPMINSAKKVVFFCFFVIFFFRGENVLYNRL